MVNDDPQNLLVLKGILSSSNYNLVCAKSGEEALKYVIKQDFAVILLDGQTPGLNGFETAKLIKEREKSKYISIIFITTISQTTKHVMHGCKLGAVDYIFKPFHPETLKMKVQEFVNLYKNHQATKLQRDFKKLQKEVEKGKKVEEELRLSQDLFYKSLDLSPCLIEVQSLIDGKYKHINSSWLENTGYSPEEVLGESKPILSLKPLSKTIEIESLASEKSIRNIQVEYQTKNGELRYGLLSSELFEIRGEKCILRVITDITERLHLESEIGRLDRLNLIGMMAASIAHEIRNPLTTVRGFLELSKGDPDHIVNYSDLMIGELDRANSIITEYLNLAKNKVSFKKSQKLNPIIKKIYPLLQAQAIRAGKSIFLQLEDCPELLLDEKEINQLILNLSLNGLDAMKVGGELIIKTHANGQEVILEVQDQGCGIEKDIIPEIATPFFTTKDTGTGLGLAICYWIAKQHDAIVDIETSVNGTVFSIRFNTAIRGAEC
jgi:PAS domain S-box-containing protein